MSVDYGDGAIFYHVIWLALGQVDPYLIQTFSEKVKSDKSKVQTCADKLCHPLPLLLAQLWLIRNFDWLLKELSENLLYECLCKMTESLKLSTESINVLLSYFPFQINLFLVFQKISANSNSHNVKKEVEPKDTISVVKGLMSASHLYFKPNWREKSGFKKQRTRICSVFLW